MTRQELAEKLAAAFQDQKREWLRERGYLSVTRWENLPDEVKVRNREAMERALASVGFGAVIER